MDYKKIKGLVEKLGELEMSCYKDCRDARKTLQEIKLDNKIKKALIPNEYVFLF